MLLFGASCDSVALVIINFLVIHVDETYSADGQVQKTTTDFISDHDYPYEIHHVTTQDGYVLELHRIPYRAALRRRNKAKSKTGVGQRNSNSKLTRNLFIKEDILRKTVDKNQKMIESHSSKYDASKTRNLNTVTNSRFNNGDDALQKNREFGKKNSVNARNLDKNQMQAVKDRSVKNRNLVKDVGAKSKNEMLLIRKNNKAPNGGHLGKYKRGSNAKHANDKSHIQKIKVRSRKRSMNTGTLDSTRKTTDTGHVQKIGVSNRKTIDFTTRNHAKDPKQKLNHGNKCNQIEIFSRKRSINTTNIDKARIDDTTVPSRNDAKLIGNTAKGKTPGHVQNIAISRTKIDISGNKKTATNVNKTSSTDDIPLNRKKRHLRRRRKGAAFLMHGLLASSADWVVPGPEKGLAFILSDAGYDVWLGNARGNKYSRNHRSLNPDSDPNFWEFSWHEIGTVDLTASIDYILNRTRQDKLTYIGHSQGTTSFFVMASEKPEYNAKIKSMHALAPVAYMRHMYNPYALAGQPLAYTLEALGRSKGAREVFPPNDELSRLSKIVCSDENAIRGVCVKVYLAAFGFDPANVNRSMIPDIMQNIPAGASSNQFIHYAQVIRTGRFQLYDYGLKENSKRYSSLRPPEYDLTRIKCPVALYYGDRDDLGTPPDVRRLAQILPNLIENYRVDHSRFTHVDFLWASHVKELLYDRVLQNIDKYT